MIRSIILFILLSIGSGSMLRAQSAGRFMTMGDQAFHDGDYYSAASYYLKAVKTDSLKLNHIEKLANAYRLFNNYSEAEKWYAFLTENDTKNRYPEARFWYGNVLRNRKKYKEAIRIYQQYSDNNKRSPLSTRVLQELKSCDWALRAVHDSIDAEITHLSKQINTSYNEFNPLRIKDSVFIFSSLRLDQESDPQQGVLPGTYLSQLFEAKVTPAGLSNPVPMTRQLNESGFHNSNITVSHDHKLAIFTRCEDIPGPLKRCSLYQSKFRNGKWQKAFPLDERFSNSSYTTTQPFLAHTDKEDILFFVSDRPGGQGKNDLWYSILKKNRFQDPVNLGPPVNTPGDELTPFYHAESGMLYFSSDWHEGYGGYDIFRSKGNYNQWSMPENVRQPFNSEANDLYFFINSDDSSGYFTSNRPGSYFIKSSTCCNDNYAWHFRPAQIIPAQVIPDEPEIQTVEMQIRPFLPLSLYFHNDIPKPVLTKESTDVAYNTTVAEYYLLKNKYIREYSKSLQGKAKDKAALDIEDFFDNYVIPGLSNLEAFSALLAKDLEAGTDVTLTISGYTSPLNSDDYNKLLSKRRISSLVNYFNEYQQGRIKKYLGKTSEEGGRLTLVEVPLGEEKSDPLVSDNPNDLRNSVYSRSAAFERKIQITGYIRQEAKTILSTQPTQDVLNKTLLTSMLVDKEFIDLGAMRSGNNAKAEIRITNTGASSLRIIAMETSCGCTLVDWPKEEIPAGKSAFLKIYFDSRNKTGEQFENISIKANIPDGEKNIIIRAFIK